MEQNKFSALQTWKRHKNLKQRAPRLGIVSLCLQERESQMGTFYCVLLVSGMRLSWVILRLTFSVWVLVTEVKRLPWLCQASLVPCISEAEKG